MTRILTYIATMPKTLFCHEVLLSLFPRKERRHHDAPCEVMHANALISKHDLLRQYMLNFEHEIE